MTFEEIFGNIKEMFKGTDVSSVDHHLAFQFNITGEGAGTFYAEIKDGRLYIEPYSYNDRDASFTASADVLMKIIGKQLDPIAAFTFGKLKIEGDIGKALEVQKLIK